MIVRSFLRWSASAPASARAEGANALARAYLSGNLKASDRADAEAAMIALVDDPSPMVRFSLAGILAFSPDAPHVIITALASDRSDIASLVLGASPVLGDAELVDAVALGDADVQVAVAGRRHVSVSLAAAIAEVGLLETCVVLCRNPSASINDGSIRRMIERFGDEAELREALLSGPPLDAGLRHDLVVATANALARFVTDCAWLSPDRAERVAREAQEQGCMTIAADTARQEDMSESVRLVRYLRESGRLTPALILRALLSGNSAFFEAAMGELSGMSLGRVAGLVRWGHGIGFGALYAKAGLPPALMPIFRAAALDRHDDEDGAFRSRPTLNRQKIARVLASCAGRQTGDLAKVAALLHRFEAEAAREDARAFASQILELETVPGVAIPRLTSEDRPPHMQTAA